MISLVPKFDEECYVTHDANYDFVYLVETCMLQSHIHNNIIALDSYNLLCRDMYERTHRGGGSGFAWISKRQSSFNSVLENLADTSFEVLWVNTRTTRLPRSFSNLVKGTVYHPTCADNSAMLDYLSNCLSQIESCSPTVTLLSWVISIG